MPARRTNWPRPAPPRPRRLRAAMALASKDFERQQQLFQKNYISQAALERAEADFKAT